MVRQTLKNTYHTSSLYLLKFLAFLETGSLKRAELQRLFEQDADCLLPLSTDTLRLYANALEELGCLVQRPNKSNDFQYKLDYSSFFVRFTPQEWQLLLHSLDTKLQTSHIQSFLRVYEMAEHLSQQKFFTSDAKRELRILLNRYIHPSQVPNLKRLERSPELNAWFSVQYQGKESLYEWKVLHDTLILENRRLYWLCYQVNLETGDIFPLMLRIDRCHHILPIASSQLGAYESIQRRVLNYIAEEPELACSIVMPKGMNFNLPRLRGEKTVFLSQNVQEALPFWKEMQAFYEVEIYAIQYTVKTTHLLYLMQCLRASGGFIVPSSTAFSVALANIDLKKKPTVMVERVLSV